MLRIDRKARSLTRLERRSLSDAGFRERADIQAMVKASPEAFFAEIGESLLLVGEEIRPSELVADRIDLLALDEQGNTVIIELKRGSDRLQLLQALTYAAMVASWSHDQVVAERARLVSKPVADAEDDLAQFLPQADSSAINQKQRIMLMAEDFDWEVLATAEWLNERYGVDIRCYRLALSQDASSEYLSCTCIYPPPELSEHVKRRRQPPQEGPDWSSWEEALAGVSNPALVDFFKSELKVGVENRLRTRSLVYRCRGRRVFYVDARRKHAYAWQQGRFDGDLARWKEALGHDAVVRPVEDGRALSFVVARSEQFHALASFLHRDLPGVEFSDHEEPPDESEDRG